jgi:UDP:flavonoid glycosyltransferase YjiC (YdhE family)
MRVLISSVTGYGHLQPLVPLATALSKAGHDVAIAIGPELRPRAEAAGFAAFDSGIGVGAAFERLIQRFPDQPYNRLEPAAILGWYLPHLFGEVMAPAMLADLEPLIGNWRPDVLVHDSWEFAGPIAAASAGIPSISHTLGLRHDDGILSTVAAAVAPLWRQRGLDSDSTAGLYRHLCLDTTPPSLQPYQPGHRGGTIHPLRPIAQAPVPGEHLPVWVGQQREKPLVYMTLGTNTNSDVSMFRSVIDGLCDMDVDVLVTIGYGKDSASIGSLPANAHVENYIPQSLLLPHCSAVVCHGGAGTTLNSLALGLPLLMVPQGADQYVVSDLVVAAGAGLQLAPSDVRPSTIRAAVSTLLELPHGVQRASARRLQAEIAAMPGPDEVVHLIEAVSSRVVI